MKKIKNKKSKIVVKENKNQLKKVISTFFLTFFVSFFIAFFLVKSFYQKRTIFFKKSLSKKNPPAKINVNELKKILELEKGLYFDPLNLIEWLKKPDEKIVLVDIRDKGSFEKERIKTAVNFQEADEIIRWLKNKKLTVVIYSSYGNDLKTKTVAYQLINQGIQTKILSIGYNEFRHLKILWLPQSLWEKINLEDFIERKGE
jgi:rhodanese-related sulfurtransferase